VDEAWLQERIAANPRILSLGDLILKDRERAQSGAGRLDPLLQDPESLRRYESEIQLGDTDESHITRTIGYWAIERCGYPHYEYCAVIAAETVTVRFPKVTGLFNGRVPLIPIQMRVEEVEYSTGLIFARVSDQTPLEFLSGMRKQRSHTRHAPDVCHLLGIRRIGQGG